MGVSALVLYVLSAIAVVYFDDQINEASKG